MTVIFWWAWFFARHDFFHLVCIYGFPLHQSIGHGFHFVAVFINELVCHGILLIQDTAHFSIHLLLRVFRNVFGIRYRTAQEHFALVFGIHHHTQFV